jgi:hypothetical protein
MWPRLVLGAVSRPVLISWRVRDGAASMWVFINHDMTLDMSVSECSSQDMNECKERQRERERWEKRENGERYMSLQLLLCESESESEGESEVDGLIDGTVRVKHASGADMNPV